MPGSNIDPQFAVSLAVAWLGAWWLEVQHTEVPPTTCCNNTTQPQALVVVVGVWASLEIQVATPGTPAGQSV